MRPHKVVVLVFTAALTPAHAAGPDGAFLFRTNCAFCHGSDGHGGRGPSLVSARIVQNTSDEAIKNIVKNGIPGTGMSSFDMESDEIDAVVAEVRALSGGQAPATKLSGDPARGRTLYVANGCPSCHRIGGEGSVFGPELDRIGAMRSPEYLRESIVNPSADIAPEFEGVTLVTREGRRFTGVRINEDTFSIQIRLPDQRFASFDKATLQSLLPLDKSLMPTYSALPRNFLDDLVSYLAGLRGDASSAAVFREKGIR
jgi:putative heme-binding domain-containing protein